MDNYQLVEHSDEGFISEYSADPADYWANVDTVRFDGMDLVKIRHPYRTVTGGTIYGPRLLKSDPTMRDLRRLADAL
jgi:hypothetical protein